MRVYSSSGYHEWIWRLEFVQGVSCVDAAHTGKLCCGWTELRVRFKVLTVPFFLQDDMPHGGFSKYGSQVALSMCMGLLFLSGGQRTLGNNCGLISFL